MYIIKTKKKMKYLIHPESHEKISLYSESGKNLLKQMIKSYNILSQNQNGGGPQFPKGPYDYSGVPPSCPDWFIPIHSNAGWYSNPAELVVVEALKAKMDDLKLGKRFTFQYTNVYGMQETIEFLCADYPYGKRFCYSEGTILPTPSVIRHSHRGQWRKLNPRKYFHGNNLL